MVRMEPGSSPRMRGTRRPESVHFRARRIIPAYAGNTECVPIWDNQLRDHPRVCGEHFIAASILSIDPGSSPRMRGTRYGDFETCCRAGIIPAYAGNTPHLIDHRTWCRDHPRVCGEHFEWEYEPSLLMGSSPRMRGTLLQSARPIWACGIIPAYAGNTPRVVRIGVTERDHPRVCGEHSSGFCVVFPRQGSSPRMRGTPEFNNAQILNMRIIPAYAGNTCVFACVCGGHGDHPRVCGEHADATFSNARVKGSSPRMRGTLIGNRFRRHLFGIIPAYAGNTYDVV